MIHDVFICYLNPDLLPDSVSGHKTNKDSSAYQLILSVLA